jgi:hypothetical protein
MRPLPPALLAVGRSWTTQGPATIGWDFFFESPTTHQPSETVGGVRLAVGWLIVDEVDNQPSNGRMLSTV